MKNFIKVPRQNDGVEVLININKIRVVAPSEWGCSISLDQPLIIKEIDFNIHTGVVELKHEPILFETTSSLQQIVEQIVAAQ